jgi:hypothetical protein
VPLRCRKTGGIGAPARAADARAATIAAVCAVKTRDFTGLGGLAARRRGAP